MALLCAIILFAIPLKIRVEDNARIPIIGDFETFCQKEINKTLGQVTISLTSLAVIQAVPKAIPAAGETISKVVERLDYLQTLLMVSEFIVGFENYLFGLMFYLSFHWIIPLGLILYAVSKIKAIGISVEIAIRKCSGILMKIGILLFLLVPITACINHSLNQALDIESKIKYIEEQKKFFERFENTCPMEQEGVLGKITDMGKCAINFVKKIFEFSSDSLKLLGKKLNEIVTIFLNLVIVFFLTTIIVPIGVFACFYFIFGRIEGLKEVKEKIDSIHKEKQEILGKEDEI